MNPFILSLILAVSGQPDMVLPLVAYETKDVCEEKPAGLEKDMVYKNPSLSFDCYSFDKFTEQDKPKEEEKKQ
jgi:hypothetical protein